MERKNGRRKGIDVREKFGDYLMDISKYVITAVLITMFFDDISSSRGLTYIAAIVTAVLTLLLGIVYYKKKWYYDKSFCNSLESDVFGLYCRTSNRVETPQEKEIRYRTCSMLQKNYSYGQCIIFLDCSGCDVCCGNRHSDHLWQKEKKRTWRLNHVRFHISM